MVDALRQLPAVETASPLYLSTAPFSAAGPAAVLDEDEAWASRDQIRAAEAMAYEPGDPAVVVAVVDTGVVEIHPELHDRIRRGLDTVQLGGRDLATGLQLLGDAGGVDTDASDDHVGHGTSVAGITSAAGHQVPPGLAGACGVTPIRVLASARLPGPGAPFGIGAITDINLGVSEAVHLGAKVINMSFGIPAAALGDSEDPHWDVVRYALARGCVLVAASGNTGGQERFTPACLDGVIAVGAVGRDGKPAPFSTFGEHVDLAAPGERVVSTALEGYARVTGTSFAAPFVSATAALVVSRAGRRAHAVDGAEVSRLLRASTWPWGDVGTRGHGTGVLDALATLRTLDAELDRQPFADPAQPWALSAPRRFDDDNPNPLRPASRDGLLEGSSNGN
jgi:subtilisin family serine protease